MHDKHVEGRNAACDRRIVFHRIVRQLAVETRVDGDGTDRAKQERVAVGISVRRYFHADDSVAPRAVVDDYLLPPRLDELLSNGSRCDVRAAARRYGNDDSYRFIRIRRLRMNNARHQTEQ